MTIGRILTGAVVLATGLSGAQLPEFAQQYRQRLGGAVDELKSVVERFDTDAKAEGLSRAQALQRHAENADELIKRRGIATAETISRYSQLETYKKELADSSSLALVMGFATRVDQKVAQATLKDFEPAIPLTSEGGTLAAIGAFFGWLLARVLAAPRRWLQRPAESPAAR